MLSYVLLQISRTILRFCDNLSTFLFGGYSLLNGRVSDHIRSQHQFEACAHRLKIYWRAKPQELGPADLSCFLTLHSGYEDPRRAVLEDDDVVLINVDKDGATFGVFPGLGPVDLVKLILTHRSILLK